MIRTPQIHAKTLKKKISSETPILSSGFKMFQENKHGMTLKIEQLREKQKQINLPNFLRIRELPQQSPVRKNIQLFPGIEIRNITQKETISRHNGGTENKIHCKQKEYAGIEIRKKFRSQSHERQNLENKKNRTNNLQMENTGIAGIEIRKKVRSQSHIKQNSENSFWKKFYQNKTNKASQNNKKEMKKINKQSKKIIKMNQEIKRIKPIDSEIKLQQSIKRLKMNQEIKNIKSKDSNEKCRSSKWNKTHKKCVNFFQNKLEEIRQDYPQRIDNQQLLQQSIQAKSKLWKQTINKKQKKKFQINKCLKNQKQKKNLFIQRLRMKKSNLISNKFKQTQNPIFKSLSKRNFGNKLKFFNQIKIQNIKEKIQKQKSASNIFSKQNSNIVAKTDSQQFNISLQNNSLPKSNEQKMQKKWKLISQEMNTKKLNILQKRNQQQQKQQSIGRILSLQKQIQIKKQKQCLHDLQKISEIDSFLFFPQIDIVLVQQRPQIEEIKYKSKKKPIKHKKTQKSKMSDLRKLENLSSNQTAAFPGVKRSNSVSVFDKAQNYKKSLMKKINEDLIQFNDNISKGDNVKQRGHYTTEDVEEILAIERKKIDQNIISFKDFEEIKPISAGAYATVILVKKKSTKQLFAMKIIDCSNGRINEKQIPFILLEQEQETLKIIKGKFIVKPIYNFYDYESQKLYFVMEYLNGGDMGALIEHEDYYELGFPEFMAQFYFAEIALGINCLHKQGITHRDLKPDNILIDSKGHIKITDFGLSQIKNQTNLNILKESQLFPDKIEELKITGNQSRKIRPPPLTIAKDLNGHRIVGTANYIAPEVLTGEVKEFEKTDWWSLGCILFEFLTGTKAFNGNTVEECFENIINKDPVWPELEELDDEEDYEEEEQEEEEEISEEAKDLVMNLLQKDPQKRYGYEEINNHSFMKHGMFFKLILKWSNKTTPLFDRKVKDEYDTDFFKRGNNNPNRHNYNQKNNNKKRKIAKELI